MIAIPNTEKPKSCGECEFNYNLEGGSYEWWECVILHDDINQFDTRRTDCPLIEIAEPTETLIHDIRKLIALIEPRMIIASTYAEQIERAEAVKDWLLSIVGEPNATKRTQNVESVGSALKGE